MLHIYICIFSSVNVIIFVLCFSEMLSQANDTNDLNINKYQTKKKNKRKVPQW